MEVAHEAQIWWVHGDLPTLPHEVLDRGIHPRADPLRGLRQGLQPQVAAARGSRSAVTCASRDSALRRALSSWL
jgi:hypothetical protein